MKKSLLYDLLKEIPYFYWITSTYGKYNGFICNSIYSLTSPRITDKILQVFKEEELISDYFIFEINDYATTKKDLSYFDPKLGWVWNWDKWAKEIKNQVKEGVYGEKLDLEEKPAVVKFDFKDILIIRNMKKGKVSLKELGKALDLSDSQVGKRIRRLEKEGIIKAYISVFTPRFYCDSIATNFYLKLNDPNIEIFHFFSRLPYQIDFIMESKTSYCITFCALSRDLKGFIQGFEQLKPLFSSYFIQFIPVPASDQHHLYKAYNEEKKCWDTSINDYIRKIKKTTWESPNNQ